MVVDDKYVAQIWNKFPSDLKYLMDAGYPNGVEFEFLWNEMDGCLKVRCLNCAQVGISWHTMITEELMVTGKAKFDVIQELKHMLAVHATQHNVIVQKLVEKYDLKNLKKNLKNEQAPPPKAASKSALEASPGIISDEEVMEFFEAVEKNHPITPENEKLFEAMYKAAMYKDACTPSKKGLPNLTEQPVEKENEHRRISLDEEE